MRNFHISLPEEVYVALRARAERMKRPATLEELAQNGHDCGGVGAGVTRRLGAATGRCASVAREAIESWLQHCRKASRHQAISEFAKNFAGTEFDLDTQLEAAGAEHVAGANRNTS